MVVVAVAGIATAVSTTAVVLDETVYKYAAVRFADGFPAAVRDDQVSRGVARLWSLILMPVFSLFGGDVAVRLARALTVALFVATALPVRALARRLGAGPWAAVAAGLGAVAVPWLSISTILFSESLAYLLFACALLVMARTLRAPTWRWELGVLVLLGALVATRVQFVALVPAWVLAVLIVERPRGLVRRFPLTALAGGGVVLGVLVVLLGALGGPLDRLSGPYAGLRDRKVIEGDYTLALLFEVEMLAIGVGVVPALLAAGWFTAAFGRRLTAERRRLAVLCACTLGLLFAGSLFAQGGWLNDATEERYYLYAVPVLWAAGAAALSIAWLPARWLGLAGAAFALCVVLVPLAPTLYGETTYLSPVSSTLNHELGPQTDAISRFFGFERLLASRDLLLVYAVALVVAVVMWWRRRPGSRALVLVPAAVVQLGLTLFVFAAIHGKVEGLDGTTTGTVPFAQLGWVDRATPGAAQISMLDNQTQPAREAIMRETVFWNDEVLGVLLLERPGAPLLPFPVQFIRVRGATVGEDLRLSQPPAHTLTHVQADSPLWQPAGREVARSPDGRSALVRIDEPASVAWLTRDLDLDGQVTRTASLSAAGGRRVTVVMEKPPIAPDVSARVTLGDTVRVFDSAQGARQELTFDLCDEEGPVDGTIETVSTAELPSQGGRFSAGSVAAVRVERC